MNKLLFIHSENILTCTCWDIWEEERGLAKKADFLTSFAPNLQILATLLDLITSVVRTLCSYLISIDTLPPVRTAVRKWL